MNALVSQKLEDNFDYFNRTIEVIASRFSWHLRDECISEGLLIMVTAAEDWDPEGGASFTTFVTERLDYRLTDFIRHEARVNRKTGLSRFNVSIFARINEGGDSDGQSLEEAGSTFGGLEQQTSTAQEIAEFHERVHALAKLPENMRIAMAEDLHDAMEDLHVGEARIGQLRREARNRMGADLAFSTLTPPSPKQLTNRESELLLLVAKGFTNGEVGEKLFIAENSVKSHIQNILGKLQAENRTHAVYLMYQSGQWSAPN